MPDLISICIPTHERPDLLAVALKSCLAQSYRPIEILVGDDSSGDETQWTVEDLGHPPQGIELRYIRNSAPSAQSTNVNNLLDRAGGRRSLILHDDDWLCPSALADLDAAWTAAKDACCVYGKQYIASSAGETDGAQTDASNELFFRTARQAERPLSNIEAAILQQIPNDAFLVSTDLARRVRYAAEEEVGHAVDSDFGVRLAVAAGTEGRFVYIDTFVSYYRNSEESISRSEGANLYLHLYYDRLMSLPVPEHSRWALEKTLKRMGATAALEAAQAGAARNMLKIMRSGYYEKSLFSASTAFRFATLLMPRLARLVRNRLHASTVP